MPPDSVRMKMNLDVNSMQWLEPWEPIPQDDSKFFETELQREISSQHALYNVEVKAVARRIDSDDVLYALINHRWPYAVVHLTYAGSDSHAEWPHTQFFESLQDWIEEGMKVDNRSYNS